MASLLPYKKVQRQDQGFDFFDQRGRKIGVDQYVQATGSNKNQLVQDMANSGDRVSQSYMKIAAPTRQNLFAQDAKNQQAKDDIFNPANVVRDVTNAGKDLAKMMLGGIQQGAGVIGDIALQGGAMVGNAGIQTNPLISQAQREQQTKRFDQQLISNNGTEAARKQLQNLSDTQGNKIIGTSDVDQNATRIATGNGDFRDVMAVGGKALDAGLSATMFANPVALARGTAGNMTGRQVLNFAGKDALMFGGTQGAATGAQVYGQTGDPIEALKQGLTAGALTGLTQGTLDGAGLAFKALPKNVTDIQAAGKAIQQANPTAIADQHPAVIELGNKLQELRAIDEQFAQQGVSPNYAARVNNAKAQKAVIGEINNTRKSILQGGYAKVPQNRQGESLGSSPMQQGQPVQPAPKELPLPQQSQPTASTSRVNGLRNEIQEPIVQSQPSVLPIAREETKLVLEPQSSDISIQQKPNIVKEQRRAMKDGAGATYGLRDSFDAADNVPDELKMSLGAFGNSRTVKSNKELWQAAQQRTGLDSAEAMKYFNENNNDEAVATGYALISKYMKSGNTKEAGDIAMTMAERALESGRQTQAYAMMKKLTPEGSIAYVARKVNKYLDKNPKLADKVKWNDQVQRELYKLAEEVNALPEGRARNLKIGEMQMKIDNIFPSSLSDKAITVWKAGLLTSLRTQERNIVGNALNAVSEQASTLPGSLADRIMSLRTKKRTLVTSTGEGLGSGAKYGGEIALDQLRTGIDVTDSNLKMNVNHITWGDGAVEKVLKGYTESVFRTLGASDKVFKEAARKSSLYNQALAMAATKKYKGSKLDDYVKKIVANPTAKMLDIADNDASRATFTHDNVLGDLVKKGKQSLRNQKSEIPSAVADIIVPFTQVPTGVASQLFAYSPANLFKSLYDISKVLITGNAELQRGAAQGFGRSVVGTAVIGGGAYLMSKGLMTGQPEDDAEKAQWEAQGKMPNSIKVGDRWYQLGSIGPQTILLLAGGQAMKDAQEGRNPYLTMAGNLGKSFKDQTFLKGMSSALDAIDDPKRYATNFVESTATSVIPNIVKDIAKTIDPNVRETQGLSDRFKGSLPGTSTSLPERLDSYGQPLKNRGLGAMFDLFNSSKEKPLPEAAYIDALRESVGTKDHVPTKADRTITINGETKKLNSQELHDYQEYIGTKGKAMIDLASKDPTFNKLSDEEKAGEIDKQLQAINTAAKIELFGNNPKTRAADVKDVLSGKAANLTTTAASGTNLTPAEKYQKTLADYEKNKDSMSDIKRYATEGSLKKLKVAAPFSTDVVELYGMSKEKIYDFVTNNKEGKKLADQLFAYDKALNDAGLSSYLKFKNGIAPAAKKVGSGKKGGGKGGAKSTAPTGLMAALNDTQKIRTPKFAKASTKVSTKTAQKKTALKTYNAKKSTKIVAKRGVSRTA